MALIIQIIQFGMRLNLGVIGKNHAQAGSKGFEKFKSDVGAPASIAKQNGAFFKCILTCLSLSMLKIG